MRADARAGSTGGVPGTDRGEPRDRTPSAPARRTVPPSDPRVPPGGCPAVAAGPGAAPAGCRRGRAGRRRRRPPRRRLVHDPRGRRRAAAGRRAAGRARAPWRCGATRPSASWTPCWPPRTAASRSTPSAWTGAAPLGLLAGEDLAGSTLEQQLAKNPYEDGAQDPVAKARSVVLAGRA